MTNDFAVFGDFFTFLSYELCNMADEPTHVLHVVKMLTYAPSGVISLISSLLDVRACLWVINHQIVSHLPVLGFFASRRTAPAFGIP